MLNVNICKKLGQLNIKVKFNADTNGVTAIYGKSGAGKTSIINMIAGLIKPDNGYISFNNKDLFNSEKNIDIPTYKRNIGYVFQDGRLFPHLNIKKNLLYGAKRKSESKYNYNFDDIVNVLGINHLLDRMPLKLSGGEKQRVAIGRALLSNPEILLMDEPLAALDFDRRNELLNYISIISKNYNVPILYVTHSTDEIIKIAKNMLIIDKGKLIDFGNAVDLLNKQNNIHRDFGVVCEAEVVSYDETSQTATIQFGKNFVEVSSRYLEISSKVRFKINAIDVVITNKKPPVTSIRNEYKGIVIDIKENTNHFHDILIDIGMPIWARITYNSLNELSIEKGREVYCLIKSAVISSNMVINSPD